MSTTGNAPAALPAAEEAQKSSKHKREKKSKPESRRSHHRQHGHSKASKRGEAGCAEAPLSSTTAAVNDDEDWVENRAAVERLCAQYPNNICCDCGESGTRWTSVNHGVFVCIRCSGVHRSLGTHVSKVKSTNMDRWSLAEVRLMEAIGNAKGKTLYEARMPPGTRPTLGGSGVADDALKSFIQRKYADREFALSSLKDVLGRLYRDTGYGRPPKKSSRSGETAVSTSNMHVEPQVDRAAITGKRGDTVRALYGEAADEMQRGALRRKKGVTGKGSLDAAADPALKPTYGTFGLVSVPADEYEERRRLTLEAFSRVEAAAATREEEPVKEEPLQEEGEGFRERSAPLSPLAAATEGADERAADAIHGGVVGATDTELVHER
ncbi:hypothetical protein ABL78_2125 [Leptomonas seymouri]|uniref:Arf-GAP domain-containing protein n=1 Tax=Leptomonas seymouri TaxID=5684 RepID=A0A0N0P7F7_LEPSE|nr:hypothetical protein ABL78_2125 [Leptomonas seymouri]|eukprot:KPI88746.1 hypothetical protein ABL78_2125 [Leptomonas seymouri]